MTLRMRLFLIVGGLIAVLVLAQWWWTRALTRELSAELDAVASTVGRTVAGFFVTDDEHRDEHLVEHHTAAVAGSEEETDDGGVKARRKIVQVVSKTLGEADTRHGYLEFDSESGDVKVEGDLRLFADEVEVTDLGGGRFAFAFRLPEVERSADGVMVGPEGRFKVHLEHVGDERYLFVGGPRHAARRIQIHQGMTDKLGGFSRRLMLASLGLLVVGLVLAGAVAHRMSAPLRRLGDAARQVGAGALGTRVPEAAGGEVGQAIAAFNHMSDRLAELEARTRELSARQHLGEIGEIARGLAHSLRNPLNALGLSVEELAARTSTGHEADDGAGAELAVSARRQIRRIDRSIRSFLALASQGGGSAAGDVDLAELVADVALEVLQDGRGRVRIETDVEPGPALLRAVEPELRAVVQALVVNAVEASPDDGSVTVRLRAGEDGKARLEVEDRGPGLPTEVRDKLFTPHLSTKASGSGMGLFLAHRIATNRYRGHLELEDHDGGGTRAVLVLGDRVGPAVEDLAAEDVA